MKKHRGQKHVERVTFYKDAILGPELLPGDCQAQNRNGKLFSFFLKDNNLICVNSLPLTKGVITRS